MSDFQRNVQLMNSLLGYKHIQNVSNEKITGTSCKADFEVENIEGRYRLTVEPAPVAKPRKKRGRKPKSAAA